VQSSARRRSDAHRTGRLPAFLHGVGFGFGAITGLANWFTAGGIPQSRRLIFRGVTTRWPSGLNRAELTLLSCVMGWPNGLPLAASHSREIAVSTPDGEHSHRVKKIRGNRGRQNRDRLQFSDQPGLSYRPRLHDLPEREFSRRAATRQQGQTPSGFVCDRATLN
jgi:hypothetical protein